MKYIVDVFWTVARSFDVEAKSRDEAEKKMLGLLQKGDVCVWTDNFEATEDVEVRCSGEYDKNGESRYY